MLSEDERRAIQIVVDAFLASPLDSGGWSGLEQVAAKANAVPVYVDIGGALLVDTIGRVWHVSSNEVWNAATEVKEEHDPKWRGVAFAEAAARYPTLQFLRPQRPPSAVDCPTCKSTTRVLVGAWCGRCWGLGWIENESG